MLNDNEAMKRKLRWAIESAGVTRDSMQSATGLSSKSGVSEWLRTGRIAKKHLPVLAALSRTTDRWWLTPEAPVPPTAEWLTRPSEDSVVLMHANAQPETARTISKDGKIPVVGTAKLGDDGFFCELEYPAGFGDGYINLPSIDPHAYAVRCRGDSMAPRIKNGEFVVVHPSFEVKPGDEVLVRSSDGRVMVKQYLYRRDGRVHLLSVNESHPSLAIDEAEIEVMHYVWAVVKSAAHIQE